MLRAGLGGGYVGLLAQATFLAVYDFRCLLFHGELFPDEPARLAMVCLEAVQPVVRGYLRRLFGA